MYLATEDGSAGTKGNVLDAVKACGIEGDILFACGPTPMLRAIKQYAKENGLECYLSLEEKWHAELVRALPVYASPHR